MLFFVNTIGSISFISVFVCIPICAAIPIRCDATVFFHAGPVSFASAVEVPARAPSGMRAHGLSVAMCSGIIGGVHQALHLHDGYFQPAQGLFATDFFLSLFSDAGANDNPFWVASPGGLPLSRTSSIVSVVCFPLQPHARGTEHCVYASVHEFATGGVDAGVVVEPPNYCPLRRQ